MSADLVCTMLAVNHLALQTTRHRNRISNLHSAGREAQQFCVKVEIGWLLDTTLIARSRRDHISHKFEKVCSSTLGCKLFDARDMTCDRPDRLVADINMYQNKV